jgi:hypothetical protein
MAQKRKVNIGDVWNDARGRSLEVVGPIDSRGKVAMRNLQTGRPINSKGPRALVQLVRKGTGPKITASSAGATNPAPRAPRKPRQLTPAQIAAGFGGGGGPKRPKRRKPPARARAPKRPSTTPMHLMAPMPAPFPASVAPNPSHYPSPLAQSVAEAMSALSPAAASNPHAVRAAAMAAIDAHTVSGMRNPYAESDPFDLGEEPYENPPMIMAPAPMQHPGYPGQYGMGLGSHAGHQHPMNPMPPPGYPGQYGMGCGGY